MGDVSDGTTGNGDGSSSDAFPPPDMSGALPGEGSTGGESNTSDSDTLDPTDTGPELECDTYSEGCAEGEKCNPWANDGGDTWNALSCFPINASPAQVGDSCAVEGSRTSGIDTCALGSMCWDVDEETNVGECVAFCDGSPGMTSCADPTASCMIANDGVLNLCLPGCDPLMQDCAVGQGCYPLDASFVCAPDASGGSGQAGAPCEFVNACDPAAACIVPEIVGPDCAAGSTGCCTEFCDLTAPVCTLMGQECMAWFERGAAPPQYVDVGLCGVPA